MLGLAVTTAPTTEPLELGDVKTHLRFPYDYEDALIRSLITAARLYCETVTGMALVTQTLRLTVDAFPTWKQNSEFWLPRPPLASVTSIKYDDANEVEQTVSTSVYTVNTATTPGIIGLKSGQEWPADCSTKIGSVRIVYVAGYGAASAVPATVKQAMLLLIGHWFTSREAAITGTIQTATELAVKSLLASEWCGSTVGAYS